MPVAPAWRISPSRTASSGPNQRHVSSMRGLLQGSNRGEGAAQGGGDSSGHQGFVGSGDGGNEIVILRQRRREDGADVEHGAELGHQRPGGERAAQLGGERGVEFERL